SPGAAFRGVQADRRAVLEERQRLRARVNGPSIMNTIEFSQGEAMTPVHLRRHTGKYALATGEAAAYRLAILHELYGPGTRRLLLEAGLRPGMRVAELGCGVGMVTALLADLVGPTGSVVGVDSSGAQLAQARERLNTEGAHISFVEASATATGLA